MAPLDAQQNFMLMKYNFFSFYVSATIRSKVIAFFCEKIAKAEHTICDCNWLGEDIQTN